MASSSNDTITNAIAERKRAKQALIRAGMEHNRAALPHHTEDCCQWCTDNRDAMMALDREIDELQAQRGH